MHFQFVCYGTAILQIKMPYCYSVPTKYVAFLFTIKSYIFMLHMLQYMDFNIVFLLGLKRHHENRNLFLNSTYMYFTDGYCLLSTYELTYKYTQRLTITNIY